MKHISPAWLIVGAFALGAGGPIGISLGLNSGQARDAALAIAAENSALKAASNLSDLVSPASARTALGLGTAATSPTTAFDAAGAAAAVQTSLNSRAPATSLTGTPVLQFGGTAATATYTVQTLRYVQIGPVVEFVLDIEWSALSAGTGAVTVTGLPAGMVASPELGVSGFGVAAGVTPYATVNASGQIVFTTANSATAPGSDAALPASSLSSVGGLIVTGRFFVS